MTPRRLFLGGAALIALTGCGPKPTDDHASQDSPRTAHPPGESQAAAETTFKAGTGLTIPPATRVALGLTTAPAEERAIPQALRLQALVYQAGPPPLASVTLPAAQAAALAHLVPAGAHLVLRQPHSPSPDAPVDLVFALAHRPEAKVGDFVELALASETPATAVSVPRGALLRTAGGTFVYVSNGGAYLRTAVTPGASSAEFVAITDGLYAGDEVVTHPVEQLWLIELRLTKGGGHSH